MWKRAGSARFSGQEAAGSRQQDDTVMGRDGDASRKDIRGRRSEVRK